MYVPPFEQSSREQSTETGSKEQLSKPLGKALQGVIAGDMACLRDPCESDIMNMAARWVEAGLSSYDFLDWLEHGSDQDQVDERVLNTRFLFHRLKREYRCEKLFLWTLLDFYFFRGYDDLIRMAAL